MMSFTTRPAWRPALAVLSRLIAALFGGYGLAVLSGWLITLLLAHFTDTPRADAVLTGMLPGFLVFACAALWAFAARDSLRAWLGLLVPAALMALPVWLLWQGAGA